MSGTVGVVEYDEKHLSRDEALDAGDPSVGDGTPSTADWVTPELSEEDSERVTSGKLPTKKWLSAFATALVLYVVSRFTDVDKDLEQLVNIVAPLIVSRYVPNDPTPGGVPDAVEVS